MELEGFFAEEKRGAALDEYPPFYVRGEGTLVRVDAVTLITNGFDVEVKPLFGVRLNYLTTRLRLNYLTTRLRPLFSVLFDYLLSAFWFAAFVLLRNSIFVPKRRNQPTDRSARRQPLLRVSNLKTRLLASSRLMEVLHGTTLFP
jgi:hypothetical protein